jgi:hypothetical protein
MSKKLQEKDGMKLSLYSSSLFPFLIKNDCDYFPWWVGWCTFIEEADLLHHQKKGMTAALHSIFQDESLEDWKGRHTRDSGWYSTLKMSWLQFVESMNISFREVYSIILRVEIYPPPLITPLMNIILSRDPSSSSSQTRMKLQIGNHRNSRCDLMTSPSFQATSRNPFPSLLAIPCFFPFSKL